MDVNEGGQRPGFGLASSVKIRPNGPRRLRSRRRTARLAADLLSRFQWFLYFQAPFVPSLPFASSKGPTQRGYDLSAFRACLSPGRCSRGLCDSRRTISCSTTSNGLSILISEICGRYTYENCRDILLRIGNKALREMQQVKPAVAMIRLDGHCRFSSLGRTRDRDALLILCFFLKVLVETAQSPRVIAIQRVHTEYNGASGSRMRSTFFPNHMCCLTEDNL